MNLADLRRTLGVDSDGGCGGMGNSTKGHTSEADDDGLYGADSKARRRLSMERMDLLKVCLFCLLSLFFLFASILRIAPHQVVSFFHYYYESGQVGSFTLWQSKT